MSGTIVIIVALLLIWIIRKRRVNTRATADREAPPTQAPIPPPKEWKHLELESTPVLTTEDLESSESESDGELYTRERLSVELPRSKYQKIGIFGSTWSGKTTLANTMADAFGCAAEGVVVTGALHSHIIKSVKKLKKFNDFLRKLPNPQNIELEIEDEKLSEEISFLSQYERITQHTATLMRTFWNQKAVQNSYKISRGYMAFTALSDEMLSCSHVSSCDLGYFLIRIHLLQTWGPPTPYVHRIRGYFKTRGFPRVTIDIAGRAIVFTEYNGTTANKGSWKHLPENLNGIVFAVSLSDYDLQERGTNKLTQSLGLFEEICNLDLYKTTPIIIFLNKSDLFERKLKTRSLKLCPSFRSWPSFGLSDNEQSNPWKQGRKDEAEILDVERFYRYIGELFVRKNNNVYRKIHYFVTSAFDEQVMRETTLWTEEVFDGLAPTPLICAIHESVMEYFGEEMELPTDLYLLISQFVP